jgi:pimeloyl-ACP methyl ester carboxylesterase
MTVPALFFIHGMWGTPAHWGGMRAYFEARGHATYAPCLPWHDVDPRAPAPPQLADISVGDYVSFLIDQMAGIGGPVVLVGHSMGAMLAQLVAERVQPSALILLSPGPTAETGALAISPLRTTSGVTTKAGWWKKPTKIDRDRALWGIYNEVPADIANREVDALVWDSGRVLFQMAMPWADPAHGTRLDYGRLRMPALVVVGDQDRITPVGTARGTARKLAGQVDYRELPGVGHWLFHSPVVEKVSADMTAFLATLA